MFWNKWPLQLRVFYWLLVLITFFSVSFFIFTYFAGYELVIDWKVAAFFEEIPMSLGEFKVGDIFLQPVADNLLILQNFVASPLEVNVYLIATFLFFICLGSILLLTISSYLPRIWYFVSIGIWIVVLSSLRLEILQWTDLTGYMPLIIIGGSTLLLSFYFNSFYSKASFILRLISFITLFLLLAIAIGYLSKMAHPFLFIASNSLIPMMMLTVVFLFIIAHEIMASFIYILTRTGSGSKNHVHFLVISAVYLLNLVIVYLHHIELVDWNIWYINPYLLLMVSFILGIWGYKQREQQYQHIFSFNPLGAFFYLSFSIIAFATIGFFFGTANDPALEVIEEGIIYGHLGFGFIFLLYIIANFSTPLGNGQAVHKIMYKPTRMPYFMFRFAGLVTVFGLVIAANWVIPFNYSFGAYFNQQGDLAMLNKQNFLQEGYYQQSRIYAYRNHHANYALANFYTQKKETGKASFYYLNIMETTPSAQSYVNLSHIYSNNNRFFDALFTLQDGVEKLNSGHIYNNIALLYNRTEITDSAFYYLEKALDFNDTRDEAVANMEAIAAAKGLSNFIDSLEIERNEESITATNNKIVRFNQQKKFYGAPPSAISESDSLNFFAAGITYNYLLNTIYSKDTSGIKDVIKISDKYIAGLYHEKVRFAQAVSLYYHHYVQDAFRLLNALANESYTDAPLFFNTLGYWALEQNSPDQAAAFFRRARLSDAEGSVWREAFSRVLNHQPDSALNILDEISFDTLNDNFVREIASARKEGSEISKLNYIKYHLPYYDSVTFSALVNEISTPDIKAQALLSYSKSLFDHDRTDEAIVWYEKLGNIPIKSKELYNDIVNFELKLLAAKGQLRGLATQINEQQVKFSFEEFPHKVFYTALLNAASDDSISAMGNFRWIAQNQPFHSMEVALAVKYIKNYSSDQYEAYDHLLNALEINPLSVILLKAYIREASELGLERYATNALQDLKELLHPEHYQEFLNEYYVIVQDKEVE